MKIDAVFFQGLRVRGAILPPLGFAPQVKDAPVRLRAVEILCGAHLSRLRNPLIADAFHRTGAVEIWGRGTNRVIDECRRYGVEPPTFREEAGALIVTFKAPIAPSTGTKWAPSGCQVGAKLELSQHQTLILQSSSEAQTIAALMGLCGRKDRTKFRNMVIKPLLEAGLLQMTIPDKPRSSRQRYRTTPAGMGLLKEKKRTDQKAIERIDWAFTRFLTAGGLLAVERFGAEKIFLSQ